VVTNGPAAKPADLSATPQAEPVAVSAAIESETTLANAERFGHRFERLAVASTEVAPIQRTKYEWDGSKWNVHSRAKKDTDAHPHPKKKKFGVDLEPGDRYDQNTGVHRRRAHEARQRLERAADREERRQDGTLNGKRKRAYDYSGKDFSGVTKKNDNREILQTPFGDMRFGRGMYNTQPFGTFDPEDWDEDKPKPKHNYDALSQALEKSKKKSEILDEMSSFLGSDQPVIPSTSATTNMEKAAATGLTGLLTVAEPHQTRNPVGGKPERAAVRYAKKTSLKKVFNRKNGAYVPAWAIKGGAKQGGTSAWQQMRSGDQQMPLSTLEMLSDLSSSSSDESESSGSGSDSDSSASNSDSSGSDSDSSDSGSDSGSKKQPRKYVKK